MSIEKNTNEAEIGGSELDGMGIKVLVDEIMPKAINIAAATQQNPLRVLVDIVKAVGRKEHPAIIEKIGHEYLWNHRHELPWLIQPPHGRSSG